MNILLPTLAIAVTALLIVLPIPLAICLTKSHPAVRNLAKKSTIAFSALEIPSPHSRIISAQRFMYQATNLAIKSVAPFNMVITRSPKPFRTLEPNSVTPLTMLSHVSDMNLPMPVNISTQAFFMPSHIFLISGPILSQFFHSTTAIATAAPMASVTAPIGEQIKANAFVTNPNAGAKFADKIVPRPVCAILVASR